MSAKETKHDKFLRLMQARLWRTLEEFRLVNALASNNYINTPEEALEVVKHLNKALTETARVYDVPFTSAVGSPRLRAGPVNEIDIAKALDEIQGGDVEAAADRLRKALSQEPR